MQKTSNLYVRVEPEIKDQAEKIFESLGLSMSNAIGLFLRQVIINQGIPFELTLSSIKTKPAEALTDAEFDEELGKGYSEYLEGKGRPVKEVFSDIRKGL